METLSSVPPWFVSQRTSVAIAMLLVETSALLPCYYMLNLTWNWEWSGAAWMSALRKTRWTREERKSLRLDKTLPRSSIFAVSLNHPLTQSVELKQQLVGLCWTISYIPGRLDFYLLRPTKLQSSTEHQYPWFLSPLLQSLFFALQITGGLAQLEFNRRSGTFAGDHALTAQIRLLRELLRLLYFVRPFIGALGSQNGLTLARLARIGWRAWAAYQACTLPQVEQCVTDVEEE
jgi:hypothetical protein